jgi:hypothetical protein
MSWKIHTGQKKKHPRGANNEYIEMIRSHQMIQSDYYSLELAHLSDS